ncbi:MAG: hypothetical protein FWG63_08210 [Defluviitaleaceae bacterium]|nr:hypothetical protein [Defluviitaleaceae bacterium]
MDMKAVKEQLIKSESAFSFNFDGGDEIEAVLLSKSINDIVELTKLTSSLECKDAYIKIKITSFEKGSFQIYFSIISEAIETIARPALTLGGLAVMVISIIKGYFDVKKHLEGKQPKTTVEKDNGKIEIENENGQKIEVESTSLTIINNTNIELYVNSIIDNVMEHNPNGGFNIKTEYETTKYVAEDMLKMAKPFAIKDKEDTFEIYHITTALPIKKADLLKSSSWEFIFQGKIIKATILDTDFLGRVHKGLISVKARDYINAKLEIKIPKDNQGGIIGNKEKYSILKVLGEVQTSTDAEQLTFLD